jgi:hypothetical protein
VFIVIPFPLAAHTSHVGPGKNRPCLVTVEKIMKSGSQFSVNLAGYTDSLSVGLGLRRFHSLRADFVTGKANHYSTPRFPMNT